MDTELLIEVQAPDTMKWLHQTITGLVDAELDVFIECDVHTIGATFKVSVNPNDVGKIVGKNGQNARAIRGLLYARGRKEGVTYAMDLREAPRASGREVTMAAAR